MTEVTTARKVLAGIGDTGPGTANASAGGRTVAIMQPYFMPYLGYWQLIAAADVFVVLDDVQYIKGGWINRNRILLRGAPRWLTVPLRAASPNRLISEIELAADERWRRRVRATLHHAYGRASCYDDAMACLDPVLDAAHGNLADFLTMALGRVVRHLGLATEIVTASAIDPDPFLRGKERVLHLCRALGADRYINSAGGQHLYDTTSFAREGSELVFMPSLCARPAQDSRVRGEQFLSLMHLMMLVPTNVLRHAVLDHGLDGSGG